MQQDRGTKGFTILELLVVLALIGIVSAVGVPNFTKWKKAREVKNSVEKIYSIMNSIVTQTQRGHYSYVQIEANFSKTPFQIISKGMTKDTFSNRLNQNLALDCGDSMPWDNAKFAKFDADDVDLHFNSSGAICFSKDGSYYKLTGQLDNNLNIFVEDKVNSTKNYIILCSKSDSVKNICPATDKLKKDQPLYLIAWSRFGMINKFKWNHRRDEWTRN